MDKRGAYFFALDAVASGIIILVTVYFILSLRTQSPESIQSYSQAEDFLEFMLRTQVRDFSGNYTKGLVEDGNITHTTYTLFEQLAEFQFYNKTNLSWGFVEEITNSTLLGQQGVTMWYGEDRVFNRSAERFSKANVVLSSKKVSFLRINRSYIYGPNVAEVWVWY